MKNNPNQKMNPVIAIILCIIVLIALIGGIVTGHATTGIAVILIIRFLMPLFIKQN